MKKKQNNIHIMREEGNNAQLSSLYQPKKEEHLIQICNRNFSEFNKDLKNNFLQKIKKIEKYTCGSIGLLNIGNTCYFNSAIQNLKNVFPLTLYLLKYQNPNKSEFVYRYCELIANLVNQDTYQWFVQKIFY